MNIAFPFSRRDQALALANLQWMAELGNAHEHDIILFADEGIDTSLHLAAARSCFRSAKLSPIDHPTSLKWPIPQNHVWKRIVDYVDHFKLYPFFLCESDAVPTHPCWLRILQDEWNVAQSAGKHFMGYLEYAQDEERRHMNGVGTYDDIYRYAPRLMTAPTDDNGSNYMAFDWAGGAEVVPQMHITRAIQFHYKKEAELMKDETLSWLNPDAAIFHTCKDVRIFDLLRKKLFGAAKTDTMKVGQWMDPKIAEEMFRPKPFPNGLGETITSPTIPFIDLSPHALTTDIFIKTYDKVADWHAFAMRSIERYCRGFRRTVVVGQQPVEGYQEMQVAKLTADLRTDADLILFTDSDCIFSTDVTPETYMRDGKTIWLHRNWTAALKQEGDAVMRWHRGMQKFFGVEPPHEFMCRHPELVPRWLLIAFRQFCKVRHGISLEEWILKDKEFADWNMLGMYAWLYHRESFHWINQDEETPPPMTLKQYWGGHAPIEPHVAEMEAIIAGGVAVEHKPPGPIQRNGGDAPCAQPQPQSTTPSTDSTRSSVDVMTACASKAAPTSKPAARRAKRKKRKLTPEHKAKLRASWEKRKAVA